MRLFLSSLSFIVALAVLIAGAAFIWGYGQWKAPGPLPQAKIVMVERGKGVGAIAQTLAHERVIAHPVLFRVGARVTRLHRSLKAGEYEFLSGMSLEDVFGKLARGEVYQRKITLREGLTSWQIVRALDAVPELTGTIVAPPAEGSLLPETYVFLRGDRREDVLRHMQAALQEALGALWAARAPNLPLSSPQDALTLASIVEMETGKPEERRRVASVFVNRLRKGMALQSDPTVIYALTKGRVQEGGEGPLGRRLLRADLNVDSPYNTYKTPGLPPGPIANPGRESLEAALNPEETNFLYFVADGTGGHVFSATLAEHNAHAVRWRALRKEK